MPDIDFKKLSTDDLVVELFKSNPRRRKILYKKHSILLKNINKRFKDKNINSDKINSQIQKLVDGGWNERVARDLLFWEVSKAYAIIFLYKNGLNHESKEVKFSMQKTGYLSSSAVDSILEELQVDSVFIVAFSLDKGICVYF